MQLAGRAGTVDGIVKQTGGFVFAETEVSYGTTFRILLPAHDMPVATKALILIDHDKHVTKRGDGVVLLVEDVAPVRSFGSRALQLQGYTVLEAD